MLSEDHDQHISHFRSANEYIRKEEMKSFVMVLEYSSQEMTHHFHDEKVSISKGCVPQS